MRDQVRTLTKNQVWDEGRGCFYVGLAPSQERYKGLTVYVDAFGTKLVIQ